LKGNRHPPLPLFLVPCLRILDQQAPASLTFDSATQGAVDTPPANSHTFSVPYGASRSSLLPRVVAPTQLILPLSLTVWAVLVPCVDRHDRLQCVCNLRIGVQGSNRRGTHQVPRTCGCVPPHNDPAQHWCRHHPRHHFLSGCVCSTHCVLHHGGPHVCCWDFPRL
jgi:hypothetical protein